MGSKANFVGKAPMVHHQGVRVHTAKKHWRLAQTLTTIHKQKRLENGVRTAGSTRQNRSRWTSARCARIGGSHKAWAQLVVRQGFVVKAEQLRTQQEKEKCRQRALESAQAEYEAMDARSFVVALQLEGEGLKRLTAEDRQRGKPAQYVDQSSALWSVLVEREDMQQAYG